MGAGAFVAVVCCLWLGSCGGGSSIASVGAFNDARGMERINHEPYTPQQLLGSSTIAVHGTVESVRDGRAYNPGGVGMKNVVIAIDSQDMLKDDPARRGDLVYVELSRRDDSTIDAISDALPDGTGIALFGWPAADPGFEVDGDPDAGREADSSVYFPLAQGLWLETADGLENVLTPSATSSGTWAGIDSWPALKEAVGSRHTGSSTSGDLRGVDPMAVPECPPWDAEPAYPNGPVPSGAVSIRVCPGEQTMVGPALWKPAIAPPVDALTTGVAEVVGLLNALPGWAGLPEETFCTQEGRPRVHYVIGYPDGTTRSITYGYGACHLLELGPPGKFPDGDTIAKSDASAFMAAVSAGLVDQRAGTRPPGDLPPAPGCVPNTRPYTTLPSQDLELGVAALCVLDGEDYRRAVVPSGLVARLTDDYATATTSPSECSSVVIGKVVGWSTWGDPVELQLWDDCAALGSAWSSAGAFWDLAPELRDDLMDLELGPPVEQR